MPRLDNMKYFDVIYTCGHAVPVDIHTATVREVEAMVKQAERCVCPECTKKMLSDYGIIA